MKVTKFTIPREAWIAGHIVQNMAKVRAAENKDGYTIEQKYRCCAAGHFLLASGFTEKELHDTMYRHSTEDYKKPHIMNDLLRVIDDHGMDYSDIYEINDGGPLSSHKERQLIVYFAEHDIELTFTGELR